MNDVVRLPAPQQEDAAPTIAGMNVYQRLNEIKKEVTFILKDKKVETYMAVTHDKVTELTHDSFVKWGVLPEPHEISAATVVTSMTTRNGIPFVRFEGKYRIDFVNIDSPSERASVDVTSHALDHGDKSPGKGLSYAVKAAILKILQIQSGESESEEARPDDIRAAGKPASKSSGTDGSFEALPTDRQEVIKRVMSSIVDCFDAGEEAEAFRCYKELTDNEEKLALWHLLKPHSKMRRRIKEMGEVERKLAGEVKPERDPALHRRD